MFDNNTHCGLYSDAKQINITCYRLGILNLNLLQKQKLILHHNVAYVQYCYITVFFTSAGIFTAEGVYHVSFMTALQEHWEYTGMDPGDTTSRTVILD